MQIIPTIGAYAQTLAVQLAGQACRINIYQKSTGLYIDLYVNDVLIIGGVLALDANRIVRSEYLGFIGDLAFFDTQAATDPTGLQMGTRYELLYLEADDLQAT